MVDSDNRKMRMRIDVVALLDATIPTGTSLVLGHTELHIEVGANVSDSDRSQDVQDTALIKLVREAGAMNEPDTTIMTESVIGYGGETALAKAHKRAEEIREALGLLRRFTIRTGSAFVDILAADAADALKRVLVTHGALLSGSDNITLTLAE